MNYRRLLEILINMVFCMTCALAVPAMARPEMILLEEKNTAYAENVIQNLTWIQNLPVDGIVVGADITTFGAIKTEKWKFNDVYKHLAPLVGTFPKLKNSYLRVNTQDMGDPFDDWSQVWRNWNVIAKAAHTAGMKGIFFDNEAYTNPCVFVFGCTDPRGTPTLIHPEKSLQAYQNQFRVRGADLMRRLQIVWPDIRFIHAHGPYWSEPAASLPAILAANVPANETDLRGYFFTGMLRAALPAAQVIDGGELYNLRTTAEFDTAAAFRRTGITTLNTNLVCPTAQPALCPRFKSAWVQTIKLGMGLFDIQQVPQFPMTPAILQDVLGQAFRTSDGPVWLYTEGIFDPTRSYLSPGHVDQAWIDAIAQAVARAGP